MSLTPPPARPLPDLDRVLARVLADTSDGSDSFAAAGVGASGSARRSRWTVAFGALAAAGVVGATVVGGSVLRPGDGNRPGPAAVTASSTAAPATTSIPTSRPASATPAPVDSAPLPNGPLTAVETRSMTKTCTDQFDVQARSTAHARYVDVGGVFPDRLLTVVVTAADGSTWGCSAPVGKTQSAAGGQLTGRRGPDRARGSVGLGSAATIRGTGDTINLVEASGWAVLPGNATAARVRWLVNGVGHPWRTSVPIDGFAFLVVHLDAPIAVGDVLVAQAQVLDPSGRVLEDTRGVTSEVVQRDGHVMLEGVR